MSQIKTRRVSYSSIVGSKAFQQGVKDYQRGIADFDRDGTATWHYERGRLFAASLAARGEAVPPSRVGRRVSARAIVLLMHAFRDGAVI